MLSKKGKYIILIKNQQNIPTNLAEILNLLKEEKLFLKPENSQNKSIENTSLDGFIFKRKQSDKKALPSAQNGALQYEDDKSLIGSEIKVINKDLYRFGQPNRFTPPPFRNPSAQKFSEVGRRKFHNPFPCSSEAGLPCDRRNCLYVKCPIEQNDGCPSISQSSRSGSSLKNSYSNYPNSSASYKSGQPEQILEFIHPSVVTDPNAINYQFANIPYNFESPFPIYNESLIYPSENSYSNFPSPIDDIGNSYYFYGSAPPNVDSLTGFYDDFPMIPEEEMLNYNDDVYNGDIIYPLNDQFQDYDMPMMYNSQPFFDPPLIYNEYDSMPPLNYPIIYNDPGYGYPGYPVDSTQLDDGVIYMEDNGKQDFNHAIAYENQYPIYNLGNAHKLPRVDGSHYRLNKFPLQKKSKGFNYDRHKLPKLSKIPIKKKVIGQSLSFSKKLPPQIKNKSSNLKINSSRGKDRSNRVTINERPNYFLGKLNKTLFGSKEDKVEADSFKSKDKKMHRHDMPTDSKEDIENFLLGNKFQRDTRPMKPIPKSHDSKPNRTQIKTETIEDIENFLLGNKYERKPRPIDHLRASLKKYKQVDGSTDSQDSNSFTSLRRFQVDNQSKDTTSSQNKF